MNATIIGCDDRTFDYKFEFRRSGNTPSRTSASRTFGRRKRNSPQLFNGIHRRRRKKITW